MCKCGCIFRNNYQRSLFTLPFLLLSPQRALVSDLWVNLTCADRDEVGTFSVGKRLCSLSLALSLILSPSDVCDRVMSSATGIRWAEGESPESFPSAPGHIPQA